MLPSNNRGPGMNIGAPDVCLTPVGPAVVPIPYPNFALHAQATPFSPIVRTSMVNALNVASVVPVTFGDDPGVAHPTFKGPGMFPVGNPIVYVDMLPATNLLCPTTGNNVNDGVGVTAVPNVTNVFYTLAEPGMGEQVDRAGLDALAARLAVAMGGPGELGADGVGVIGVRAFSFDLPTRVHNEIERLGREGMTALVLDLRGCPGGELDACLRMAGYFLERGLEIARVVDGDGDEVVHRARGEQACRVPLTLVVDRGTASAAEVFAASLQAHGRALVVGERTWGKGTAQRVLPGESGALYATVARCLRPGGGAIDGVGVEPDGEIGGALAAIL